MRFGTDLAILLKKDLTVSLYTMKKIKNKNNILWKKSQYIQIFIMIKCDKKFLIVFVNQ